MKPMDLALSLLLDFQKKRAYGTLEFEFRAGELTFVRRKETFITASVQEKNSMTEPRGTNGSNNEFAKSI